MSGAASGEHGAVPTCRLMTLHSGSWGRSGHAEHGGGQLCPESPPPALARVLERPGKVHQARGIHHEPNTGCTGPEAPRHALTICGISAAAVNAAQLPWGGAGGLTAVGTGRSQPPESKSSWTPCSCVPVDQQRAQKPFLCVELAFLFEQAESWVFLTHGRAGVCKAVSGSWGSPWQD